MTRKIVALVMALLVFAGSSLTAQAAVCPHPASPDGEHHFDACKPTIGGRIEDLGYHTYIYGYDENNNPISKNCKMTQVIQYCMYVCQYCGLENINGAHEDRLPVRHSLKHP